MRLQSLEIRDFKGFARLRLVVPESAKLVVLCGPNGSGKSSLIDALNYWRRREHYGVTDPQFYRLGSRGDAARESVNVVFHGSVPDRRLAVHVRTAQRVTVDFQTQGLTQLQPVGHDEGPPRTIDVDDRVGQLFRRLVSASVEALWSDADVDTRAGDIVKRLVGRIETPLERLLDGLVFEGPDNPLVSGATFRFSREHASGYPYKLLSGGEKAVFDLLLDAVVTVEALGGVLWCIDEPEVHVNPAIHGALLGELVDLLPDDGQMVVATHSAGMLAEARRRYEVDSTAVVFFDFSDVALSSDTELLPATVNRAFWQRQLRVALGDLAGLVAPRTVVLCEGNPDRRDRPRARFDSRCLENIFASDMPDVAFVSVGNSDDVIGDRMDIGAAVEAIVDATQVIRVIDRDARSEAEVADLIDAGHRVLQRRNIEGYLLDRAVIEALCTKAGRADAVGQVFTALDHAVAASVSRGNPADDLKKAAPQFVTAVRQILDIRTGGSTTETFLRDTVAPLLTRELPAYRELQRDIFGS